MPSSTSLLGGSGAVCFGAVSEVRDAVGSPPDVFAGLSGPQATAMGNAQRTRKRRLMTRMLSPRHAELKRPLLFGGRGEKCVADLLESIPGSHLGAVELAHVEHVGHLGPLGVDLGEGDREAKLVERPRQRVEEARAILGE